MTWHPQPIDTSRVELPADVLELLERLAEHCHDTWGQQRLEDGWVFGPERDDAKKEHPCLVPYQELPESERVYDRKVAAQTLKAIVALGYRIERA